MRSGHILRRLKFPAIPARLAPRRKRLAHLAVIGCILLQGALYGANLSTPFRPSDLPNGLVAYWKLNEVSGTRLDSSGRTNHLTDNLVGSVVDDYWGMGERSADFESAATNYLSITDAAQAGLGLTSTYTFCAWIKMESINDFMPIAGKATTNTGYAFMIRTTGSLVVKHGGGELETFSTGLSVGKWHHVAIVYDDANDNLTCLVDGNIVGVQPVTTNPTASSEFFGLGKHNADAICFDGLIKDAAVWNRALTPIEVKSLAHGIDLKLLAFRPGNVSVQPTAWWKLNELSSGSSPVVRLDSAGAHSLTDNNTANTRSGFIEGAAVNFDRTNAQYLTAADSPDWDFGFGDLTVSFWVNPRTLGFNQDLLTRNDQQFRIGLDANDKLVWWIEGSERWTRTDSDFAPATWYHLIFRRSGTNVQVFKDGIQLGATGTSSDIIATTGLLNIGRNDSDVNYFDGKIADMAVWKGYALTDSEIKALATGLPLQQSGIVSYWPLDETSGIRSDRIGGNHLTSNNGVSGDLGMVGGAADFEADFSQSLSIDDALQSGLDLTGDSTVLLWFRPKTVALGKYLLDKDGDEHGYNLRIKTGNVLASAVQGSDVASTTVLTTGVWNHAAMTLDGAQRRVFLNSLNEATSASTLRPQDHIMPFRLGSRAPGDFHYDGLLDEVIVAKRAFREEEIKTIYNRGLAGRKATSPAMLPPQQIHFAAQGSGSVVVSPATNHYLVGDAVTLSAIPRNTNWTRFVRWSDGQTNPVRTIELDLINVYTAVFTNFVPLEELVFQEWDRTFGGSLADSLTGLQQTSDGGFVLAGSSTSPISATKSGTNFGFEDFWIVRTDARGIQMWDRSFGGASNDVPQVVKQTQDGGFIVAGYSDSPPGGSKSSSYLGGRDSWIIRLDANGTKLWERAFGGTNTDAFISLEEMADGGFAIGGYSSSPPGVTKTSTNFGGLDYWLVRLNSSGDMLWDRSFGGLNDDVLTRMRPTADGGFILGGFSGSPIGGNKESTNFLSEDYWIVRVDPNGNKLWDYDFGGLDNDYAWDLQQTPDGGFVVGGSSNSGTNGSKVAPPRGLFPTYDFWVLWLDASGNKVQEQTFGGEFNDNLSALGLTRDGGFILGGASNSGIDGNRTATNYGVYDFWTFRLEANHMKMWDRSFGGSGLDSLSTLQQSADGGFILGGTSSASTNGNKTSPWLGASDFWAVKLAAREAPIGTPVVLLNNRFSSSNRFVFPDTNVAVVTLQTSFTNGTIRYTLDGSAPTAQSPLYSGAFVITNAMIGRPVPIQAVAWDSNFTAAATCDVVTVTFPTPPSIDKNPLHRTAVLGSTGVLSVTAIGVPAPSYQWRFNGTNLPGATLATLTLTSVALNQSGNYDVVMSNASGSVTSRAVRLTVISPTKTWTGLGDGVSWNVASNWSGNSLPTATDDIFIGGAGSISNLPANLTIKNLLCERALSVSGWLEVTGSVNVIGALHLAPDSKLEVDGPNARFVAEGATTADGAHLDIDDGGILQLPGLTSYSGGSNFADVIIEVDEVGSLADLSSVKWMDGGTGSVAVQASDGGRMDLSGLTNVTQGPVTFYANTSDTTIDLSSLETFTGPGLLAADSDATILAGQLEIILGVSLEVYPGGTLALTRLAGIFSDEDFGYVQLSAYGVGSALDLSSVRQLEGDGSSNYLFQVLALNGGLVNMRGLADVPSGLPDFSASGAGSRIDLSGLGTANGSGLFHAIDGGTILAGQLTNLVGASIELYPGSTIVFTNLRHYSGAEVGGNDSFLTARSGSVLDLSSVRLMEAESSWHTAVFVQTENYGQVNLSGTTNIPSGKIYFSANGYNSLIDLSALKAFNGPGWLIADPGASILAGQLTNLVGVTIYATGDGSLVLPQLRHISGGLNMGLVVVQAFGDGCTLDLSSVTRMEGSPSEYLKVVALAGGFVNLGGLGQIANGRLNFRADGEESLIDLTALLSFNGPGELVQTNGGLILLNPGLLSTNVSRALSPFILVQPQNSTVFAGSNATFSVQVDGSAPLAYQWYFNQSTPLTNATNATLTIASAGYDRIGNYRVIVANALGSATSAVATLQVAQPLTIAVQGRGTVAKLPDTASYNLGQSVQLTATTNRWYQFVSWSDGNTNNQRLITITASNNYYAAIFTPNVALEELPFVQWERTFGGLGDDKAQVIRATSDGGFIVGGVSSSVESGTKTNNSTSRDWWIIKLDADGREQWARVFGGNGNDVGPNHIELLPDGGYLLVGGSESPGTTGGWIVRLNAAGNPTPSGEQSFGGNGNDLFNSAGQLADGRLLLLGQVDRSGVSRARDIWLVQLDAAGSFLRQDFDGGSSEDYGRALVLTRDGGYLLGGVYSPNSNDRQFWALKFRADGSVAWSSTFGNDNASGAYADAVLAARQTIDGGYVLLGYTQINSYNYDWWLMKLRPNGTKEWDYVFGGSTNDEPGSVDSSLQITTDGGFIMAGSSSSTNGNKLSPSYSTNGTNDGWIIRTDHLGQRKWELSLGGSEEDRFNSVAVLPDGYAFAGFTQSTNGTRATPGYGGADYWVVKIATREAPAGTPVVLVNDLFSLESAHRFFTHDPVTVKLSTTFPGGFIYYTRNGEPADYFTGTLYTGEFQALPGETINAIAYDADPDILYNMEAVADPVSLLFIESFTLTNATPGGGGIIFEPPGGIYPSNTVVALMATNAPGWQFLYWEGDDVAGSHLTNAVTMNGPKSVKAVFAVEVFVRTNGNGSTFRSPATGPYPYGSRVWLTGIPQPANFFSRWTVTSPTFTNQVLEAPMVVTVTNAHQTNTAQFGPLTGSNRGLTLQVTGQGRITRSPAQGGPYTNNALVTLTATNEPGWIFTGWSGDANSVSNQLSLIMNTSKTIIANFAPESNEPPTVALTGPAEGATFLAPATILLTAGASDNDGTISRVEFFSGGTFIAAVTNQPYQFTWSNVPAGAFALRAQAVDNFGARATSAPPVAITVSSPVPIVQFNPPLTNGAEFITPTNVTLSASAFDPDGGVTEVRFFAGTNLLGVVTNPIQFFTYTLVWSNVPSGVHLLTAEAIDNVGGKGVSPVVSINAHAAGSIGTTLRLGQAAYEVEEDIGHLAVTVLKEGVSNAVVNFRTIERLGDTAHYTADGLSDYAKTDGSLVFAANEYVKTILIPIGDDFFAEPDETFHFELISAGSGSDLGVPSSALIKIRANDAGADTNSVLTFRFPSPTTLNNLGSIRITIAGAEGRGQWRFPWETSWRNSGSAASGLQPNANYPVEYRPLAGFIEPAPELVPVLPGFETPLYRTNVETLFTAFGTLRVQLEPAAFAAAFAWHVAGETNWHVSGDSVSLPVGRHVVEFTNTGNWLRPASRFADIFASGESALSATYLTAQVPNGAVELPRPLSSYYHIDNGFSVEPRRPWAFNGQLLTAAGLASGCAVLERVVITAAHTVFDDKTLTLVPEVNWFPQRQAGEFEPLPIRARGWYIMPGYIGQRFQERTNGAAPGESSPISEALDVAAIFFDEPVVRGGYGGFLVSTGTSNWLANAEQAMLIGYPTDDPLDRISPGKMHWLEAVPADFTAVPGSNGRLFETERFLSFPGNSGGPVLVPTRRSVSDPLTYFPAGIYLGNSGSRARVRVIDTNALALINLAATAAALGDNFTGGGAICPGCGSSNPGFGIATLNFTVGPPAALLANGGWRIEGLDGYTNFISSATGSVRLVVGVNYRLDFRDAAGFVAPSFLALNLPASQTTTLNFNYTPEAPLQLRYRWPAHMVDVYGPTGRLFQVQTSGVIGPNAQWNTWTNVSLSNGPISFPPPATNASVLFFRARTAEP